MKTMPMIHSQKKGDKRNISNRMLPLIVISAMLIMAFIPKSFAMPILTYETHQTSFEDYYTIINTNGGGSDLTAVKNVKTSDFNVAYGDIKGVKITVFNSTAIMIEGKTTKNSDWEIASIGFTSANGYTWWNSSWSTCQNVQITENSGKSFTEYTIPVNFTGTIQSTFNEVVFVDKACNNGGNQLFHWSERQSGTAWDYEWVNITNLMTANSVFNISIYSNSTITDTTHQSLNNTFEFVDDFSTGVIDKVKWCSDDFSLYNYKTNQWGKKVIEETASADTSLSLRTCKAYDENATITVFVNSTGNTYFSWSNAFKDTVSISASTHFTGLLAYSQLTGDWARRDTSGTQQDVSNIKFTTDLRKVTLTQFKNNVSLLAQTDNQTVSQLYSFNDAKLGANRTFKIEQSTVIGWFWNITIRNHTEPEPTITIIGSAILNFTPTNLPSIPPTANQSYSYTCVGTNSIENFTNSGGVSNFTGLSCNLGCSTEQRINCVQGRIPQCDFCIKKTVWEVNFELFAGFVVSWAFLIVYFILMRKLPKEIRLILWMLTFITFAVLSTYSGLPNYLNQQQTNMAYAMMGVTLMLMILLGITSIRKR